MALSNGKGYSNTPLVFLSARSKTKGADGKTVEIPRPYFEVSRVNPESKKIEKTSDQPTEISGNLSGIQIKIREYEGKNTSHVILFISDSEANETYHLDLTHRIPSRSLFNSLLSLESPENIAISIYRSKKGYESFGLQQNGQQVKWKYTLEEQPEANKLVNAKGEVVQTDYSLVDEFFETELTALAAKFGFGPVKKEGAEQASNNAAPEESTTAAAPAKATPKTAAPKQAPAKSGAKTTGKTTPKAAPKAAAAPAPEQTATPENLDEDVPF